MKRRKNWIVGRFLSELSRRSGPALICLEKNWTWAGPRSKRTWMTLESEQRNISTKVFANLAIAWHSKAPGASTLLSLLLPKISLSFCFSEDSTTKRSKKATLDPDSLGLAVEWTWSSGSVTSGARGASQIEKKKENKDWFGHCGVARIVLHPEAGRLDRSTLNLLLRVAFSPQQSTSSSSSLFLLFQGRS